jgi:hypothetical protein
MATTVTYQRYSGFGATERSDRWWVGPLLTALGLGAFGIYSTFRALYNAEYEVGVGTGELQSHAYLLSPFYSPLPPGKIHSALPGWFSPAFLILWAPGGFRLTCYYYRKAYYRAFLLDTVACGVGEPRNEYAGERRLFLFQNLHRYFLYLALLFLLILAYDVILACLWPTGAGGKSFGISVGTIVLATNVTLLSVYTFSCHSLRHLVGGNVDCFSCVALGSARQKAWKGVSLLNRRHMLWAWLSLFMVGFADFYVWMVARGKIADPALFTF